MFINDTETYVLHDHYQNDGTVAYGFPLSQLPTAPSTMRIPDTVILVTGNPVIRYQDGIISGENIRRVEGKDLALMTKNLRQPEILSYSYSKKKKGKKKHDIPQKSRNKGFNVSTYRETSAMEYENRVIKEDYGIKVGGVRKKRFPYSFYDDFPYNRRSKKGVTWKNKKVNRQWKKFHKDNKFKRIQDKWAQSRDEIEEIEI